MKFPEVIRKLNNKLSVVSGIMILAIGFISVIEVICRGLFNSPTMWTADINNYLLIWAIFLVAGYAFQAKGHVRVDTVSRLFPTRVKQILAIIAYAISFFFVVILTKGVWRLFYTSYEGDILTYAFLQIPRVFLVLVMLIGCALMFVTIISIILDLLGKNEEYFN